jgi:hypothetical protein
MEVDNKGNVGKVTQILEKEYHLSYPFVFEYEGQIYMLPETSANKTIEVYRATTFPFKWELHNVLMKGVNAVDTTLVEYGGNWWMFSIMGIEDAPNEEQLFLFYSDNPFGPWTAHRCNPFISDCRRGRQAGRLFFYKGSLYRPSQESTKHRGYALSINRITRLDKEVYQEEQVARILPEWHKDVLATHTLNSDGGMTVIDVYLKRRKW